MSTGRIFLLSREQQGIFYETFYASNYHKLKTQEITKLLLQLSFSLSTFLSDLEADFYNLLLEMSHIFFEGYTFPIS